MGRYLIRRVLTAVPTLIAISFVIFAILDLAPGDPTSGLPLTIKQEVREQIRKSLGLDEPFLIKYVFWMQQFFVTEPLNTIETNVGVQIPFPCLRSGGTATSNILKTTLEIKICNSKDRLRLTSWTTKVPVVDLITERLPQTLWVVGLSYLFSILLALPIGIISAVKQYSWFDQVGTVFSVIGYSVPTFFTGLLAILIFAVHFQWFPSIYDTNLEVVDWQSFLMQVRQMIMPVTVLALFQVAQLSRFTRSSMLDNLSLDYVRTVRAKGFREYYIVLIHVLRNSLIPVVTLIALGIPGIFGGAIITEQIFRVNGLGALLIIAIQGFDIPLVMTLTFIFAILIVIFNIIADIAYGILDPRIRYN